MKVAILETVHFQYGLTQSELFEEHERYFFVTQEMHDKMHEYNKCLCVGRFIIISSVDISCEYIIKFCQEEKIDLFLISPIFDSYSSILKIIRNIDAKVAITIHNLNFWLNSRFRTLKYYKERKLKQAIVKESDYIILEDFIYNYVKNHKKKLFNKYNFLYIPYTIFHKREGKKHFKNNDNLKIVLTGGIHKERRRYETILKVIHFFAQKKMNITFSFAGRPIAEYGKWVVSELDKANEVCPGIATYFPVEGTITPDMFLHEMETSDLVISTSTNVFNALGTKEYIGKTKPTAAIHDMMSFQLPGLLPSHLIIPENLSGSVFNYSNYEELKNIIQILLDKPELLKEWKNKAESNSLFFTAEEIRKRLPFFNNNYTNA